MHHHDGLECSKPGAETLSDEAIVARVRSGDVAFFELLMRRYNQRLYRVVRSILGNDVDAEDAVQDAYVRAYEHLAQFRGEAAFSTWLTRIAINESLRRRKRRQRMRSLHVDAPESRPMHANRMADDPIEHVARNELRGVLERSLDALPVDLRAVFTMRVVDGLDTRETAACLSLSEANVKTRLHRARALLQEQIDRQIGEEVRLLHQFDGARCDRLVENVMRRLVKNPSP